MALKFTINNENALDYLIFDSLSIDDEVNSRNTASFSLVKPLTSSFDAKIGEKVEIKYDSGTGDTMILFAGTVENVQRKKVYNDDVIFLDVDAVDFNWLADKRVVAADYREQYAGDIVRDLLTNFLEPEGVSAGTIEDGPFIEQVIFNFSSLAAALDELADLVGFVWKIDYNKILNFTAFASTQAPIDLNELDNETRYRNLRSNKSRSQYRNRQYVRGGEDTTNLRTETFVGDGASKSYTLSFKVAEKPTDISVNGSPVSLGIRGLEDDADYYWSANEKEITQDSAGTPLTASDTLSVSYRGKFPIVIVASDGMKQAERVSVEGGTGFYEDVETSSSIEASDFAGEYADSLIRKYGFLPEIVSFEADIPDYFTPNKLYNVGFYNVGDYPEGANIYYPIYQSGEYLDVSIPSFGINEQFLIDSVSTELVGVDSSIPRQRVKLVSGEHIGGWQNFYKKLVRLPNKLTIRQGEIINDGRELPAYGVESIEITETLTATQSAPESRVGYAQADLSETGVI